MLGSGAMKLNVPVEYLGERPEDRTIDHAMVFVINDSPDDSLRPLVSLLELACDEERPVLLAGAPLTQQALVMLKLNAARAQVVPVRLDEDATDHLIRVSGAQPVAFAAPLSFQHAGYVSRVTFGDGELDLWSDPSGSKPGPRSAEGEPEQEPPVARVRENWLQLALYGAEPVRHTLRDEHVWRLAQKLATIERRMAPRREMGIPFSFIHTPPVEPSELTALETAIGGPLPEDYVAFALRLARSLNALPNFAIDFPDSPSTRAFEVGTRQGRALRLGSGQREADYNEGLWVAFGSLASGRVLISEEPSDQVDEGQEPPMGRPSEGFLSWIEKPIDLCLRMSEALR